tara:strand:- start:1405 stop:1608 length:204 start_codon:yes stop_codon:yes gene_type:complete
MDYVKKLLKVRKAGAELELSLADANNSDYDNSISKRIDEIAQIDAALLVLYPVSQCTITSVVHSTDY